MQSEEPNEGHNQKTPQYFSACNSINIGSIAVNINATAGISQETTDNSANSGLRRLLDWFSRSC